MVLKAAISSLSFFEYFLENAKGSKDEERRKGTD